MVLSSLNHLPWGDLFGALILAALLRQRLRAMAVGGTWRPVPAALALALWAAFPLLQIVPLPSAAVHWLSPRTWELYWQSIWVVQPQTWMPLSLDPLSTLRAFFRGMTAWALYLLSVQLLSDAKRLEKAVMVLTAGAALSALLALSRYGLPHSLLLPALLLPVTLALYLVKGPKVYHSWQERLGRWLRRPKPDGQMLLLAATALQLAALLTVLPGEQGGWSIGLLLFALLLLPRRRLRRWGQVLALAAVLSLVPTLLPPFANHPWGSASAWRGAWRILADFPVVGVGSGAQAQIVAQYRVLLDHGRPDFLLAGGVGSGFAGLLLASGAIIVWLRSTWAIGRQRHNLLAVCLYAACLGGLLAAILGGTVPLLLLSLLAGLGTAAALHSSRPPLPPREAHGKSPTGFAMVLLALLVGQIALPLLLHPQWLPAGIREHPLAFLSVGHHQQTRIDEHLRQGDAHGALQAIALALRLRPLSPSLQSQAAEILDRLGEEAAADRLWLSAAAATADGHRFYAQRLWQRGNGEAAKGYLRRTLAVSPQRTGEFLPLLEFWGMGHEEMISLLPEEPLAQVALGEFLAARAQQGLAAGRFRQAVLLAGGSNGRTPDVFERAGEFFVAQGSPRDALEMVQSGLRHFPARLSLRRMAGSLYEELGISYRAIEEYRQCLILDPGDQWSRQRLALLVGE